MRLTLAWLVVVSAVGCGGDPCADVSGPPALTLGGTDDDGLRFEVFAPGTERNLVPGSQGGMHVWLSARLRGLCPVDAVIDRRVMDETTGSVYQFARGAADWRELEPGLFELSEPIPLILCPEPLRRPVVGRALRVAVTVTATDDDGRRVDAQIPFVPACPEGFDCEALCR